MVTELYFSAVNQKQKKESCVLSVRGEGSALAYKKKKKKLHHHCSTFYTKFEHEKLLKAVSAMKKKKLTFLLQFWVYVPLIIFNCEI